MDCSPPAGSYPRALGPAAGITTAKRPARARPDRRSLRTRSASAPRWRRSRRRPGCRTTGHRVDRRRRDSRPESAGTIRESDRAGHRGPHGADPVAHDAAREHAEVPIAQARQRVSRSSAGRPSRPPSPRLSAAGFAPGARPAPLRRRPAILPGRPGRGLRSRSSETAARDTHRCRRTWGPGRRPRRWTRSRLAPDTPRVPAVTTALKEHQEDRRRREGRRDPASESGTGVCEHHRPSRGSLMRTTIGETDPTDGDVADPRRVRNRIRPSVTARDLATALR